MMVTVVCVLFLIKLRWPKTNSIYDMLDLFKTWRSQRFKNILIRGTGWKVFFTALQVLFYHRVTWVLCSPGSFFNKYYTLHYITCVVKSAVELHSNPHTHAVLHENNYPLHFVSVAHSAFTNEPFLLLLSLGSFPVISRSPIDIHERSAGGERRVMGRSKERRPLVDPVFSFFALFFWPFFSFYLEFSCYRVHSLNLTRKR